MQSSGHQPMGYRGLMSPGSSVALSPPLLIPLRPPPQAQTSPARAQRSHRRLRSTTVVLLHEQGPTVDAPSFAPLAGAVNATKGRRASGEPSPIRTGGRLPLWWRRADGSD